MRNTKAFPIKLFILVVFTVAAGTGWVLPNWLDKPQAAQFDVDNDGKTGLAELVYIMHLLAGIREEPVIDPYSSTAPAPVPRTGQTGSFASGDDGAVNAGVPIPNPRFTDHGDGTVKDNLTGLIWLKDADALGRVTWAAGLTRVANLNNGTNYSARDYTPGTNNDWRMPNLMELASIRDMNYFDPPVSNADKSGPWVQGNPFYDLKDDVWWSSTTMGENASGAYYMDLGDSAICRKTKSGSSWVWPVRDSDDIASAPAPFPEAPRRHHTRLETTATCKRASRFRIRGLRTTAMEPLRIT